MDVREYGRHRGGHPHPARAGRFSERYPYTTGLACALLIVGAFLYVGTHAWMFDPWGMTAAWLIGAGGFIRLVCLILADLDE